MSKVAEFVMSLDENKTELLDSYYKLVADELLKADKAKAEVKHHLEALFDGLEIDDLDKEDQQNIKKAIRKGFVLRYNASQNAVKAQIDDALLIANGVESEEEAE